MAAQHGVMTGWRLTGVIGSALILMAVASLALTHDPVEGVRLVIRLTARTSLALFLLAFVASALVRLYPSPLTQGLRVNRRFLGASFAISHFLHLLAIISLARLDYAVFLQLTNIVAYVGGGLAYMFIVLMTATSFDRMAAVVGPHVWRGIHLTGMWYIWLSFALNFGKRVPNSSNYMFPVLLIGLAALIRLLAWSRLKRDIPRRPERTA